MPSPYDALFEQAGKAHNVDPDLLRAIADQESAGDPTVTSSKGAGGLMQIMPRTAQRLGVDPYKPEQAVDGAARLLSEAMDRNGNIEDAVAEYHGGPNRKLWGPKTRGYQKAVLAKYGGADADAAPPSAAESVIFGDAKPTSQGPSAAEGVLFGDAAPKPTPQAAPDAAQMTSQGAGEVGYTKGPGSLDETQTKLLGTFEKGAFIDRDQTPGSVRNPLWITADTSENDVPPGAYYVTRGKDAMLLRKDGGDQKGAAERLASGGWRGLSDVMLSGVNLLPGTDDSTLKNRWNAEQMAYDAGQKGDLISGAGRFVGQAIGAAVPIGGAEAVGAKVLGGPVAKFILGKAGAEMAPGAAKFLLRGSSLAAKGAAEGAAAGALTSSANPEPVGEQAAKGALAGAVLGPALPAVSGAGEGAANAVRDFAERWTYGGREKAVDRLIGQVAPKGYSLNTDELVPGSYPTLAEAAGESGISALERNARTNPKLAQVFSERMDQNAAARREYFDRIAKDPEAVSDAEAAREAATGKLRDAAFKGAKEADPSGVIAKIDETLKGPAGQRDVVVKALSNIRAKLDTGEGPQTDVQQLYGIRKAIGDMLDPLGPAETKGAVLAKSELMGVKDALDKAIEQAAPGFKGYLKAYSDLSKPIDEMKLLQSLKLTDQNGNITLAKVNSALDKITAKRAAGGANKEKSVSPDTLQALTNLRDDLKRAANITKGKAAGSDTAQNLALSQLAEGGGVPVGVSTALNAKVPGAGLVLGAANKAAAGQNEKLLQQLSSRLLNPTQVRPVALPARKLRLPMGDVAIPAIGGVAAPNLTSRQ